MRRHVLRRMLLLLLTLFVVSLFGFLLSTASSVDPVMNACGDKDGLGNYHGYHRCIETHRKLFGRDKAVFYFSPACLAEPDSLHKIYPEATRQHLSRLLHHHGDWEAVQQYYQAAQSLRASISDFSIPPDLDQSRRFQLSKTLSGMQDHCKRLLRSDQLSYMGRYLDSLSAELRLDPALAQLEPELVAVRTHWQEIQEPGSAWKTYVPWIIWHGGNNQYHAWLTGIFTQFDFGVSYRNQKKVSVRLGEVYGWSLVFALLASLIVFGLGTGIGVWSAMYPDSWGDRVGAALLWALESLPGFWVAGMLLTYPAQAWGWFPIEFDSDPDSFGLGVRQMVLPLIGYTFGSFALMSRILRSSLLEVLQADYIRTAYAKGLGRSRVVWKHAFRNAAIPMITFLAGVFPALIGGSAIIESIFGIHGMGLEMLEATQGNDLPMVAAVLVITGFLTAIGYLVADGLYAWVDPRIRARWEKA